MRYKIKTTNEQTYRDIQETLRAQNVQIYLLSDKRRIISTGSIPSKLRTVIKQRGAKIVADQHFNLEKTRTA